jgi:hypothetical protein
VNSWYLLAVPAPLSARNVVELFHLIFLRALFSDVADKTLLAIHALEGRAEPQPRDVFDLHVLFARPDAPTVLDDEARAWTEKAAANVAALTYDHYRSVVVAYLEPAHADIYSSRETWQAMQIDVMERILALG